jgi:hypothetical protein
MILVSIALDRQAPISGTFYHKVDLVAHRADLRRDAVSAVEEPAQNGALEIRIAQGGHVAFRPLAAFHGVAKMLQHLRL